MEVTSPFGSAEISKKKKKIKKFLFYFPPCPAQLPPSLPAGTGRALGSLASPSLSALGSALKVAQEDRG